MAQPFVNPGGAIGAGGKHLGQPVLGRKQEVEIGGGGGEEVPDEAEGVFSLPCRFLCRCRGWGGFALLLFISGGAPADEVAIALARRFGGLQIGPSCGVEGGDQRFGVVEIELAELGSRRG